MTAPHDEPQTYTPSTGMIICARNSGDYVKREDYDRLRAQLAGVVEQCAKVCDKEAEEASKKEGFGARCYQLQAEICAERIRALTASPKELAPVAQEDTWEISGELREAERG